MVGRSEEYEERLLKTLEDIGKEMGFTVGRPVK